MTVITTLYAPYFSYNVVKNHSCRSLQSTTHRSSRLSTLRHVIPRKMSCLNKTARTVTATQHGTVTYALKYRNQQLTIYQTNRPVIAAHSRAYKLLQCYYQCAWHHAQLDISMAFESRLKALSPTSHKEKWKMLKNTFISVRWSAEKNLHLHSYLWSPQTNYACNGSIVWKFWERAQCATTTLVLDSGSPKGLSLLTFSIQ